MTPLEHVKKVVRLTAGDNTAQTLIAEVLKKAVSYVSAVNMAEIYLMTGGSVGDENHLRLDGVRSSAHNSLIDALVICNRHIMKNHSEGMPPTGIFFGHMQAMKDRRAVGTWAGELTEALFRERS